MKKMFTYFLTLLGIYSIQGQSPTPASPQSAPIAIVHATIHVGNGAIIENGTLMFNEGVITHVGEMTPPAQYQIIDASGQHVYPGLILPASRVGLEEISSLRPTRDFAEAGAINPHVRTQVAYNTESELMPTFKFNGILTAQAAPESGLVSGTSSIMMLDGWNWEDATLKKDDAIHLSWPTRYNRVRYGSSSNERPLNKNYDDEVRSILDLFIDSKHYFENPPVEINLKLEALKGVFDGSKSVFVNVNNAKEIMSAITELKAIEVSNLVIVGGRDAYYVKDLIKQYNVSVVLDELHRLPSREEEDVDMPYRLPALLYKEGILVALRHRGALARSRNLPFYAGTAAAYGLSREEALQLVTSNPAKILGVSDYLGTIEKGKWATFVVSEGDLLDMSTNRVTKAFINGMDVAIEGKQQVLNQRYFDKYSK
mgnify:CR=1 FL=1